MAGLLQIRLNQIQLKNFYRHHIGICKNLQWSLLLSSIPLLTSHPPARNGMADSTNPSSRLFTPITFTAAGTNRPASPFGIQQFIGKYHLLPGHSLGHKTRLFSRQTGQFFGHFAIQISGLKGDINPAAQHPQLVPGTRLLHGQAKLGSRGWKLSAALFCADAGFVYLSCQLCGMHQLTSSS
jgi:hypothetical protein